MGLGDPKLLPSPSHGSIPHPAGAHLVARLHQAQGRLGAQMSCFDDIGFPAGHRLFLRDREQEQDSGAFPSAFCTLQRQARLRGPQRKDQGGDLSSLREDGAGILLPMDGSRGSGGRDGASWECRRQGREQPSGPTLEASMTKLCATLAMKIGRAHV